ncbi:conserved hypothetical protein [uncultured Desulfobacterium sp.]|uniref:DUF935 domain-containing protein n=1 Tax=uncultured Desulfobacterium sp. TaxID=201089 RepID=A0A445MWG8_9BACT|nr:conserved hypothetical protein [uncultured Desulfobacterium sp.]
MLYDHLGRPVRSQSLTKELAAPTLAGVRTIWTNTVASGLTPASLASLLLSASEGDHYSYLTLAEEMEERDLHYACELGKRKLAVTRLPVTVEAYSDDARDKQLADEVRAVVRRPGFRNLLKDLMDGIGKGYSVVEMMWDRSGSTWKPAGYEWRDPRFFQFDQIRKSEIRLRDDAAAMEGLALEPFKFICHVPKIKSGIPIRGGIARLAAWAYMCKGYTVKDWLAFAEVFGMPMRLGKYHSGASEDDIRILKMAVANLGSDAAAVFPDSMMIELEDAGKAPGANNFFKTLAEYLDAQVSKGILGQTATTQGTPGKLGNEEAQNEVRHDIRDDDAEQLEDTLNLYLVKPFIDLNFGVQENYPVIQLRAIEQEDIVALTTALKDLVPLGLDVEKSVVRDKLGLPDPSPGAKPKDLLRPAQVAPAMPPAINTAINQETNQDEMDTLVDGELADWEQVMKPVVDPLRMAVDASETFEELEARLPEVFSQMDTDALVKSLALALFKSRAMGEGEES